MTGMHAVVGFLPDATAQAASRGQIKVPLEVRLEQGNDEAHVRIDSADVIGVLLGASLKGETGVQVFVKPDAKIENVTRGGVAELFLRPIRDFSLFRFRPPLNVIYIDPQAIKNLVGLQNR